MTVHLAGNLPADDLNGLAAVEKKLIEGHLARCQHLVIGTVMVTGTKTLEKEGFRPNPIVTFERIEAIPEELIAEATDLLQRIWAARSGKTTLDFPDEPEPAPPLELEASSGVYKFVVVDEPRAKFTLRVLTPAGALALERHALPRRVYGDVEPGEYLQAELRHADLIDLAGDLVRDYEAGFTTADVEELVDAEIVDADEADE